MVRTLLISTAIACVATAATAIGPDLGRRDDQLRRLFTPLHAPDGAFEAYVSDESIDALARRLARLNPSAESRASWIVRRVDVWEAFGSASRFDRYPVMRLYGGIRPRLARGPIVQDGRVVASATLISPYPESSLDRLQTGTLVVVLRLERAAGGRSDGYNRESLPNPHGLYHLRALHRHEGYGLRGCVSGRLHSSPQG